MGLDITAYRGLQRASDREPPPDNVVSLWPDFCGRRPKFRDCDLRDAIKYTEDHFPGRTAGLRPDMSYDSYVDAYTFHAGSYTGGCSIWRDQLATMAGYDDARAVWENPSPGPFVELINFFDCEGLIGPEVSASQGLCRS